MELMSIYWNTLDGYIQTSSRNAVNKKLFLTSLPFLARSYRDVQHTTFRMSLKIKIVRQ
jgi:hypothetical protein